MVALEADDGKGAAAEDAAATAEVPFETAYWAEAVAARARMTVENCILMCLCCLVELNKNVD